MNKGEGEGKEGGKCTGEAHSQPRCQNNVPRTHSPIRAPTNNEDVISESPILSVGGHIYLAAPPSRFSLWETNYYVATYPKSPPKRCQTCGTVCTVCAEFQRNRDRNLNTGVRLDLQTACYGNDKAAKTSTKRSWELPSSNKEYATQNHETHSVGSSKNSYQSGSGTSLVEEPSIKKEKLDQELQDYMLIPAKRYQANQNVKTGSPKESGTGSEPKLD